MDDTLELFLRDIAMAYPGAVEEFPWGHRAIKAGKPAFVFLGTTEKGLGLSLKLPASSHEALLLPFFERTGYGLGRHGWVSATFPPGSEPPLALIAGWIEESFRAVASKKLIAELDAMAEARAAKRKGRTTTETARASRAARESPPKQARRRKA